MFSKMEQSVRFKIVRLMFGNKKPDNVDWDYTVLLSNLIEEGTVQYCLFVGHVVHSNR